MAILSAPTTGAPHSGRSEAANAPESFAERIALVEPPGLFRDGLAQAIETFLEDVRVECCDDVAEVVSGPASLCLIGLDACEADCDALPATIEALRALCDGAPIGAVIRDERWPSTQVLGALGVVGVISGAAGLTVAVAAMRLMLVGGYCLPPWSSLEPDRCAVTGVAPHVCARRGLEAESRPGDERPGCRYELTARECDVLQSLRAGHQNKIIAFELGISESTVKVHLRNIMKKLRASNRTQVAIGAPLPCDRPVTPSRAAAEVRYGPEEANAHSRAPASLAGKRAPIRLPV
jgi:DNA-binding NarL/FixJ family response regulator